MYRATITKEEIKDWPVVVYPAAISVVTTEAQLNRALAILRDAAVVGFDTETRPAFRKGQMHKVALMQISTTDVCFLIRINRLGIPTSLKDFIADEGIKKIGLSLADDFGMLRRNFDIDPRGFIDLQKVVPEYGIEELSLQKIYAIVFGERISKSQRLTNWEAMTLTPAQQAYAALDAWACLRIYNELTGVVNDNAG